MCWQGNTHVTDSNTHAVLMQALAAVLNMLLVRPANQRVYTHRSEPYAASLADAAPSESLERTEAHPRLFGFAEHSVCLLCLLIRNVFLLDH